MATELLPGTRNVFRFPTEERARPTLELMRALAPDLRSVDMVAGAYGLELPDADFRDRVDAEAAEHIMNSIDPRPGPERTAQLRALLEPVVAAAVDAARASRRAWGVVGEGRRRLAGARAEGGDWTAALEARLQAQELQAAELTMEAHLRAEEAEGVARAVSLARSGEPWSPRGPHADMEALLQAETAARATM